MNVRLGYDRGSLTGPIVDGVCIRQSFVAESDRLVSLSVCFATYKRVNDGFMIMELFDSARKVVASARANIATFRDNSYHEFVVGKPLQVGKTYEVRLRTDNCRSGTSVTAKWGLKTKSGFFFVGSKLLGGELSLSLLYADKEPSGAVVEMRKPHPRIELPKDKNLGMVSVVIPHYRCPSLLGAALLSLARQTYRGFEAIVVDDGSPEAERKLAEAVTTTFETIIPGLRFISLSENMGAPVARNVGAKESSGEYLFFLDSDCFLYPQAIEWLVAVLIANPGVAYAYGGFRWGNDLVKPRAFDADTLKVRNYISTMSLLRRAGFPGFDETLKRHQDWDLWLTMLEKGQKGICCGRVLFETPRREGGISDDENIPMAESRNIVRRKHGLE
jgi:hypothetical protein